MLYFLIVSLTRTRSRECVSEEEGFFFLRTVFEVNSVTVSLRVHIGHRRIDGSVNLAYCHGARVVGSIGRVCEVQHAVRSRLVTKEGVCTIADVVSQEAVLFSRAVQFGAVSVVSLVPVGQTEKEVPSRRLSAKCVRASHVVASRRPAKSVFTRKRPDFL